MNGLLVTDQYKTKYAGLYYSSYICFVHGVTVNMAMVRRHRCVTLSYNYRVGKKKKKKKRQSLDGDYILKTREMKKILSISK